MSRIKDTIIDLQDTGIDTYGPKTIAGVDFTDSFRALDKMEKPLKNWARNERERNGINKNHFTDNQISPNPYDR